MTGVTGFHQRHDYNLGTLSEQTVDPNPLQQLVSWINQAADNAEIREPSAMALSTVLDGQPSSRIVILREVDQTSLIFFTNYNSRKGKALMANPLVSALFYWDAMERQVSVEGHTERVDDATSDRYFASRPHFSQIASVASQQSEVLENREVLEARVSELEARYPEGAVVPRPPHWGGVRIIAHRFEFWQGRPGRMHDRIRYRLHEGSWIIDRLSP